MAWSWLAGGAPSADNSAGVGATPTANSVKIDGSNLGSALAGTIAATRLTANTEAGFSIVSYTGSGSNATVAHGLGVAPKWVIVKKRNGTGDWVVWHQGLGDGTKYIILDTNQAVLTASNIWNSTIPTSSVFSVGTHTTTNNSSDTYIAYCFAEFEDIQSLVLIRAMEVQMVHLFIQVFALLGLSLKEVIVQLLGLLQTLKEM